MSSSRPPSPWRELLSDIDGALRQPVALHCLGGFVVSAFYGLGRMTADIDFVAVLPVSSAGILLELAGIDSPLHARYGVCLQYVTVVNYPDSYEDRLREMFPRAYQQVRLFAFDPYDLVLSKLERNRLRDREDVGFIARHLALDPETLRERYRKEMRPYLARPEPEDLTLELWLEEFF